MQWRRLHVRVVWVDTVVFALSFTPSLLAMFVFHAGPDRLGSWPAYIATGLGIYRSVTDLWRWLKTWYRITDERVELRTGRLVLKYRWVPRERIRSVDTTARLRHRIARLRVVQIASGDAQAPFKLDAVSRSEAEQIRNELMHGHPTASRQVTPADGQPAGSDPTPSDETVLARLHWSWLAYNTANIWAFLVGGMMLFSLYWMVRVFGLDLWDVVGGFIDWDSLGTGWSIAVAGAVLYAIGVATLTINFVKGYWHFELVRTRTEHGTALLTRQGLLKTREVYREERRLRGIQLSEPLPWRWLRATETAVISTGLSNWSGQPASAVLPRTPREEAYRVAALVLGDGVRPLAAPLRPHPRAALFRRLYWAVALPSLAAGALAWLGQSGAVAGWLWLIPVAAAPAIVPLSFVAYRSLGHTLVGPYLVRRCGLSTRSTVVLRRDAVVGWTVRQTLVQRALGLMTIGAATAAGTRYYELPDLSTEQAIEFVGQATPQLVQDFLT